MRTLLLLLLLCRITLATQIRVPEDMPGIQEAMNASAWGDTVLVAPGTWAGLYETPPHSLTLASHFMVSGDSTHINETIMDGENQGTLLMVRTLPNNQFTLMGFTMMRGLGQATDVWVNCHFGGAIHTDQGGDVVVTDMVFTQNQSPRPGCVFLQVEICMGGVEGGFVMERVHLYNNNTTEYPLDRGEVCVSQVRSKMLVLKDFHFDGMGGVKRPFRLSTYLCDSLVVSNIQAINMDEGYLLVNGSFRNNASVSNVRIASENGMGGGLLAINFGQNAELDRDTLFVRNIEVSGNEGLRALSVIVTDSLVMVADSIHIHDNKNFGARVLGYESLVETISRSRLGGIHHLVIENNTGGDSLDLRSYAFLQCSEPSIYDSIIRNNRVMNPVIPYENLDVNSYMGTIVDMRRISNEQLYKTYIDGLTLENNLLEDLLDFSDTSPDNLYYVSYGRELKIVGATRGSIAASNVTIRESRHHNMIPEVTTNGHQGVSYPQGVMMTSGECMYLANILIEEVDGAGLLFIGDSLFADNIVVRNVERQGIGLCGITGITGDPGIQGYVRLRNVLIDGVVGQESYLPEYMAPLSYQAALYVGMVRQYFGHLPFQVNLENWTVTNCSDLRHLINLGLPVSLAAKNCLFTNNSTEVFLETLHTLHEVWSNCLLPEERQGTGNLIGTDPLFDPELGAPFLSQASPCVDAGGMNPDFNDPEDPLNPGFALWPSLGRLRNDIGFTGGPGAAAIDTSWVSMPMEPKGQRPLAFQLQPPYPNPFNPRTQLRFNLARAADIELAVYDLLGREVATLAEGTFMAGSYAVWFHGEGLASGVYLAALQIDGEHQATQKMLLVK
jgi:hypothetical protein